MNTIISQNKFQSIQVQEYLFEASMRLDDKHHQYTDYFGSWTNVVMQLFLTPELEEFWVSEHFTDDDMQAVFDYCLPSKLLDCHTVFSVRGKKPRSDGKPKFEFWRYDICRH